jgi:hypothetical protein
MISTPMKKIWKEAAVSSAKGAQILGTSSCRKLNFVWVFYGAATERRSWPPNY